MNRRQLLAGTALWAASSNLAAAQVKTAPRFDSNFVREQARALAAAPFKLQKAPLPSAFSEITYDQHRSIRFRPDRALWRGEGLPFEVQFFHRGFIFRDAVQIHEVSDGKAKPITYSPDLFDFSAVAPPPPDPNIGFAGFRLHAPMNRPDYYDEVAVFLGASYFRAVAKGQTYGISARGLSLKTADPKGEEFPAFRAFWIEKPTKRADSVVVHALLDSESATAAYRFTIRPGETTVFDVEMALYPRVDIDQVGIGTLTSMFLFDANDRVAVDDFRPAVHDSDGLAIRNGRSEELWRPLANPSELQISMFADANPRGFGLLQRQRNFARYEDLESRFETRPSVWVEPIGNSGEGAVHLVEIPTKEEIHDNIVAFWRPKEIIRAKGEGNFIYRLHWGASKINPPPLAEFTQTRVGAGSGDSRRFVLDVAGRTPLEPKASDVKAAVSCDNGELRNIVTQPNPVTGGWRISFEFDSKKSRAAELRAVLLSGEEPLSEVWLYRWTP